MAEWAGSAYVFSRMNGAWVEQQRLLPSPPTEAGAFAHGIAVFGDTIAVGAPSAPASLSIPPGQVHIFKRIGTRWELMRSLNAPVPRSTDFFGSSVALSATQLVVGGNGDPSGAQGIQGDMNGTSQPLSGAVFLFARNGDAYELSTYVKPSNTDAEDAFGAEVSIAGETLVSASAFEGSAGIGIDPATTGSRANSGAVYVFQ
jgi:hypothetical protein